MEGVFWKPGSVVEVEDDEKEEEEEKGSFGAAWDDKFKRELL